MLPSPLFFPPAKYRPQVDIVPERTFTLRQLCSIADIACKASGEWTNRRVAWREAEHMTIEAQPGYTGDVLVGVPAQVAKRGQVEIARYLLQVMAYSELFDGVARESVRGVAWARHLARPGRPKSVLAKSNAERQRDWRARQKEAI